MTHYFLPQWVHLCFARDGAIFLDVKRDKYFGLGQSQTQILRCIFENGGRACARSEVLIFELVREGLLTVDATGSRPLAPTVVDVPDTPLIDPLIDGPPRITLGHIVTFLGACGTVWFDLYSRSFEYAVSAFSKRKVRTQESVGRFELKAARNLMRVFVYLRPFFYVYKDRCLYDSLVLAEFLRRYNVCSTCVFGVKTLPFAAHCWVQTDRFLAIDGSSEYVSSFEPVFAV